MTKVKECCYFEFDDTANTLGGGERRTLLSGEAREVKSGFFHHIRLTSSPNGLRRTSRYIKLRPDKEAPRVQGRRRLRLCRVREQKEACTWLYEFEK